jgi:atypical dual specificity phosphatase
LVDALHQEVINLPLGLQRRLAIVRSTLTDPPLLLLDETTADLPQDDLPPLFDLIRKEGQRRAILFVTHHQGHARATADRVALLCGGEIREASLAQEFFESPQTSFGKQYVRTGSCSMPEPEYNYEESEPLAEEPAVGVSEPTDLEEPIVAEALPEEPLLDEGIQEQQPSQIVPPRASPVVLSRGPRGFHWLKKGVLAGTPRPGLLAEVSEDLESLQRVGIRVLVTLEEEAFDTALLQPFGIIGLHLPVPDMSVTTPEATARLCQQVARYQSEGHPVALHCRAGLGRTGTHLTCQLIYEGTGAHEALEQVRRVEPGWVQSEEQVAFLRLFAEHCKRIRDK